MATPTTGPQTSIFDYSSYAFLTGGQVMTELLLVRHGQQEHGAPGGPFADVVDPPLSGAGERQAEALGRRLAGERVDAVYTSNLVRARATGAAVAAHHGLTPEPIADLREIELLRDIPAGVSIEEFLDPRVLLGVRERMMVERSWDVYPGSESSTAFRKRIVTTIEGIAASHEDQRVVVVCHGGVINAYIAHHLGIGCDMFFWPPHTSINVVLAGHHGIRALRALGDVHHLAGQPELLTH
jgi:2,3-bisphosphoglycerate-dependent phosphoglycerate mutase